MHRVLLTLVALAATLGWSTTFAHDEGRTDAPHHAGDACHGFHVGEGAAKFFRSKDLVGMNVWNSQNEKLGKIDDLVVDAKTAHVSYCILSHGGFLKIGDKLVVVPIEALKLNRDVENDKHYFVLDMNKERLENAPNFDTANWPDFGSREFAERIDRFYGVRTAARGTIER
jgi:sporulation protein YlmC with PRC-barrel domain